MYAADNQAHLDLSKNSKLRQIARIWLVYICTGNSNQAGICVKIKYEYKSAELFALKIEYLLSDNWTNMIRSCLEVQYTDMIKAHLAITITSSQTFSEFLECLYYLNCFFFFQIFR